MFLGLSLGNSWGTVCNHVTCLTFTFLVENGGNNKGSMGPKGRKAPSANTMRLRNHPMAQSRSHGYKMGRLLVHGDVQVSPPSAGPPDTLSLATVSCSTSAASPPLTWHMEWTSLDQLVLHEPYLPWDGTSCHRPHHSPWRCGPWYIQLFSLFLWAPPPTGHTRSPPQALVSHCFSELPSPAGTSFYELSPQPVAKRPPSDL